MNRWLLGIGLVLWGGAALAQSSPQFSIEEHAVDGGGLPSAGVEASSANFLHSPASIGGAVGTARLASASFTIDGGPTAGLVPPGEAKQLRFDTAIDLEWQPSPAAGRYRLYRAPFATFASGDFGDCLQSDLVMPRTVDSTLPAAGEGFFYLVTVVDRLGREGTKGASFQGGTASERGGNACP